MAIYGAYTRVSQVGDRGDRLLSPQFQLESIRNWAKANGHALIELPPELDASGGNDDRPILQSAIHQIENSQLDGIAVAKLDRFSRSLAGALNLLARIEAAGGQVASVMEQIDSSTAVGRKTRNDFLNMAEFERQMKKEGLAQARQDAVERRGIHVAGKVPFGYMRNEDRILESDTDKAKAVKLMFKLRTESKSWKEIADAVQGKYGYNFAAQSIARMVGNRVYLGEARNGEFVNSEAHEPLIDRATFEAAQLKHPRPPRGSLGPALLSGVLICAGCGHPMVPTSRAGVRAYRCRRHHKAGECPEPAHVGKWVESYLEDRVRQRFRDRGAKAVRKTNRLQEAENELRTAEQNRDDFATATAGMPVADITAGMTAHSEAVREATRQVAEIRAASEALPDLEGADIKWDSLSVEKRRNVLRTSLGGVVVKKGNAPDPDRLRILAPGVTLPVDRRIEFDNLVSEIVSL